MQVTGAGSRKRRIGWKRLDAPGVEEAVLYPFKATWHLVGRVETSFEEAPAIVRYHISSWGWTFSFATVSLRWRGSRRKLAVFRDRDGSWRVSRRPRTDLSECEDVDLSITPSTNTFPIRRLGLEVGEHADMTAAWVRFPELTVEPLRQRYTRLAADRYRYESFPSGFTADLETDDDGLVVLYPNLWARA